MYVLLISNKIIHFIEIYSGNLSLEPFYGPIEKQAVLGEPDILINSYPAGNQYRQKNSASKPYSNFEHRAKSKKGEKKTWR
jgi:hypothetical protein